MRYVRISVMLFLFVSSGQAVGRCSEGIDTVGSSTPPGGIRRLSFPADRYVGSLSLTDASDAVPTRKMLHIAGQVQDARLDSVVGAEVAVMELTGDDYAAPKSAKLLEARSAGAFCRRCLG